MQCVLRKLWLFSDKYVRIFHAVMQSFLSGCQNFFINPMLKNIYNILIMKYILNACFFV